MVTAIAMRMAAAAPVTRQGRLTQLPVAARSA